MAIAEFIKSPLTEVVCGVEFSAPEFSAVHFGLYWQRIREQFPVPPQDLPPIVDIDLLPTLPKLCRVWFESADKRQLIQLQANRFHYNWRRQSEAEKYPHFEDIYPKFEQEWQIFQNWWIELTGLPLQPVHYELTYLNQLDKNFGWNNPGDTSKIFTFAGKEWNGFLKKPRLYSSALEFILPNNLGILTVSLNSRLRIEDNSFLMFFELTSRSVDTSYNFTDWFHAAHEYTVKAFLDLIQEEIKHEWGFQWLA
ncbi:TIGR04255 family protein [Nostoc sp.]|uniref:TIGR04255 family protein n=1 Tax=Nostoc sp. TaxID=1180 RepID=UPI002FFBD58F